MYVWMYGYRRKMYTFTVSFSVISINKLIATGPISHVASLLFTL